jgi:hypothetical protein
MNNHLKLQLDSNNCELLPNDVRGGVFADFEIMSHLGIDNDEDQNKFFLIRNHVPEILNLIFKTRLNEKLERLLAAEVFKNRDKLPIGTLLELIEAIDLALKKMIPENIRPKIAYPQPNQRQPQTQYDIGRWVDSTRKIYSLMSKGYTATQAKESVIENWERSEQMDYEQWLKFYKEQVPEKYPKLAFDMSEPLLGGLPVNTLKAIMPTPNGQGHAVKVPPGLPQHLSTDVADVRDMIESQRKKLIGRLNAAEKLLSSMDGQLFAGDDQELMLKLLQDLKRKIQIANKRTVKSSLFEDHIYRIANLLKAQGKNSAAGFFFKVAQLGDLGAPIGEDLLGMEPEPTSNQTPSTNQSNKQETHDLLKEFFDNIKRGVNDMDDTVEERRELEKERNKTVQTPSTPVEPPPLPENTVSEESAPEGNSEENAPPPPPITAMIDVDDQIKIGGGYWHSTIKFAQVPPRPAPVSRPTPRPAPIVEGGESDGIESDNTDDIIEAALRNVTINDVINRLEMLVSIYNQREISRQLAILDIMMDRLGLASFFPSLGEAMSKALEANQYIGNRLSEILAKVKGSVDAPGASEWIEVSTESHPETSGVRSRLEQEKAQDEKRKEQRKQQELAKMQGGVNAPTAVGEAEDLQRPSRVEKAPKLEVR